MSTITALFALTVVACGVLYVIAAVRRYAALHGPRLQTPQRFEPVEIRLQPIPRRPLDSLRPRDFIPFHVQINQGASPQAQ